MADITKDWKLYEAGKKYNNSLKPNYYATIDTNLAFFSGDQWRNVQANGMPTPVFNIIKRSITFFIASLTANKIKLKFEPLLFNEDSPTEQEIVGKGCSDIANAEVDNLFEKFKMDNRIRDALFDASTMGDVAAHLYFDVEARPYGGMLGQDVQGEIQFELIDGTNVFFGNANNTSTDVNTQPYIIISGRDTVENLKAEAKKFNTSEEDVNSIKKDNEYQYQAGDMGKIEVEADDNGKALYIIVYRYNRETKTVTASKSVAKSYIYKDIDTGLSNYPISWLPWERQKNQFHGRAICTSIIPNQIFINKMFAMCMYNLMLTAFPKAVYDSDRVQGWSNEIGAAIPINGLGVGESIKDVAGFLEPGNMSNQIVDVIDRAVQYTKETLGINDAMMGDINPEQASGKSIIATVQQSSIPLENVRANLYEWIENIGKILLDMMGTYYGLRPIVADIEGQKQIINFDFEQLKNLWLKVKTDVGATSYWSELASMETISNLLEGGFLDIITALEHMPDGYINQREQLIEELKQKQAEMQQQQMMQQEQQAQQQQVSAEQQQQQRDQDIQMKQQEMMMKYSNNKE